MAIRQSVSNGHNFIPMDDLNIDIEERAGDGHLINTTVKSFAWRDITVTVKDHKTKQPKSLLWNVNGIVKAGMSQCHNQREENEHD